MLFDLAEQLEAIPRIVKTERQRVANLPCFPFTRLVEMWNLFVEHRLQTE